MGHSRTPTQNTTGEGFPADPIDGSRAGTMTAGLSLRETAGGFCDLAGWLIVTPAGCGRRGPVHSAFSIVRS
jgi:hypothetical protein